MGNFLQKIGAIESLVSSHSCPSGTTGRICAIRLRRRFSRANPQQHWSSAPKTKSPYWRSEEAERTRDSNCHLQFEYDSAENELFVQGEGRDIKVEDGRCEIKTQPIRRLEVSRHLSKAALAARTSLNGCDEPETPGDSDLPQKDASEVSSTRAAKVLYASFQQGDPHGILKALKYLIRHDGVNETAGVFSNMPNNTFSAILRSIDPDQVFGRYQRLLEEVSPEAVRRLGMSPLNQNGYSTFCAEFLSDIRNVIKARQESHSLCLSDFKYLLKCARVLGNPQLADEIWNSMDEYVTSHKVGQARVIADAECYNHYLAAKCYSDVMNPILRFRLRIIPNNVVPRTWQSPPYTLRGHRLGPERGIKAQILSVFHKMSQSGIAGSEEAFCWMVIALAREGEIAGVGSILNRIWDVDVSAIVASSDDSALPPAKSYLPDSPLHPTKQLLFTIAHAYSINNDIPTALRLIDHISRQYSIPIPESAWSELFNWTFVLSQKLRGARLRRRTACGQLPAEAVSNLWATMTAEPYNVKPTMGMYNQLIVSLLHRQRYGEVQLRMIEAQHHLVDAIRRYSHQAIAFNSASRHGSLSKPLAKIKNRDIQYWHLRAKLYRSYLRRWVRLTIHHASKSLKHNFSWTSRGLPNFIEKWELFLPRKISYTVRAGAVSFPSGAAAQNAIRRQLREGRTMRHRKRRTRMWIDGRLERRRELRSRVAGLNEETTDQAKARAGVDSKPSRSNVGIASDWEQ